MHKSTAVRRVLVTGAGSGIGRATALRMAKRGDRVLATVRDAARCARLQAELASSHPSLQYRPLDYERPETAEALAEELRGSGTLDVLVHNAGFGVFGPLECVSAEDAERQLQVNLMGPLHLTRMVLPLLRKRRGHLIWIGSLAGRFPLPFQAHYSASKAAVAAASDALRIELAPLGVRVTCVEPGDFATGFTDARHWGPTDADPYTHRLHRTRTRVEETERSAPGPDRAARVIDRISRSMSPPARRPVGRGARLLCLAQRMLPQRLVLYLVGKTYHAV